jgi:hypothetical protein
MVAPVVMAQLAAMVVTLNGVLTAEPEAEVAAMAEWAPAEKPIIRQ